MSEDQTRRAQLKVPAYLEPLSARVMQTMNELTTQTMRASCAILIEESSSLDVSRRIVELQIEHAAAIQDLFDAALISREEA
jgi:hypothetical protein